MKTVYSTLQSNCSHNFRNKIQSAPLLIDTSIKERLIDIKSESTCIQNMEEEVI